MFDGHVLIIGMSGSGKSTLAKMFSKHLKERGHKVAVLDPLGDPDYSCDFHTKNPDEFLAFAKANRDHYLFVDEGGETIGRYNTPMQWLATNARHLGHLTFFITQGVTQLAPIIRDQCGRVFMFTCDARNAEILATSFAEEKLRGLERLDRFHFVLVSRYSPPKSGEILLDKGNVRYDNLSA